MFLQILDERFVIKQMNKEEVKSLIKFGPSLISYIVESVKANKNATVGILLLLISFFTGKLQIYALSDSYRLILPAVMSYHLA